MENRIKPMRFQVRCLDPKSWAVREQTVESTSRDAASASLSGTGAIILAMNELKDDGFQSSPKGVRIDISWWCRELKMLLVAGMTVVEAIETLQVQTTDPAQSRLYEQISALLQQGMSLSSALSETQQFPSVMVAGVIAGERTGALVGALDEYLRYHEMIDQLKRKLVSAALYPALVLIVGAAVVLFLLWFVVPRFSMTYANLQGTLSMTTRGLVAASTVLREHSVWFGWGLVGLTMWTVMIWRSGRLPGLGARLADAIPVVRKWADEFRLAKLYHALALMFRGGYTLPEALQRCTLIGLGPRMSGAVAQARERLSEGRGVAAAFGQAGLTDAVSERLLLVGERTGSFEQVLQTVADRFSARFSTAVERATRLAEPVLLLIVSSAVGGVVGLMYLPIFDLAGAF